MVSRMMVLIALLASAGCSKHGDRTAVAKLNTFDVAEPPAGAPMTAAARAVVPAVSAPRIAYSYTVTYGFDRRTVAQVQGRQLALCRQLGPAHCLVVKSTLSAAGSGDHVVTDGATLLVDAGMAGEVNRRLDALAVAGGATVASRQVEAQDVTRQVIDTDARVRAKEALAERLLAIVRSGNGKVGELVEAERAYATTQEELEAARGEHADLARRVAMSEVAITYSFDDTPGRNGPVRASLAAAGDTLSASVGALVTAAVALVPWLLAGTMLVWLVRWLRRRLGWRWPRRSRVERG